MKKNFKRWIALALALVLVGASTIYTADTSLIATTEDAGASVEQKTETTEVTPQTEQPTTDTQEINLPQQTTPDTTQEGTTEPEETPVEVMHQVTINKPDVDGGVIKSWTDGEPTEISYDENNQYKQEITEGTLFYFSVTPDDKHEIENVKDQDGNEIVAESTEGTTTTYKITADADKTFMVTYKEVAQGENEPKPEETPTIMSLYDIGTQSLSTVPVTIRAIDGSFEDYTTTIHAGLLEAPEKDGYLFSKAVIDGSADEIGYTAVYNGQIYYSQNVSSDYAMLLGNQQKIVLLYEVTRESYTVDYKIEGETAGSDNSVIIGDTSVKEGASVSFEVKVGQGYKAIVQAPGISETLEPDTNKKEKNQAYKTSNITSNETVMVSFEKTSDEFNWEVSGKPENWHGAIFTPQKEINGNSGTCGTAKGTFTHGKDIAFTIQSTENNDYYGYWELNSLEINNQSIAIPQHHSYTNAADAPKKYVGNSETTYLSDGSQVTVRFNSYTKWENDANKFLFNFKVSISNAREKITVTSGNFHAVRWPEVITTDATGIKNYKNGNGSVKLGLPIATNNRRLNFTFQLLDGYEKPIIKLGDDKITPQYDRNTKTYSFFTDSFITPYYKNLSVKASPIIYAVNYDLDGGNSVDEIVTDGDYTTKDSFIIPKNKPSKSNAVFNGWKIGEKIYQPGEAVTIAEILKHANDDKKLSFVAQWSPIDSSMYGQVKVVNYLENLSDGNFKEQQPVYITAYLNSTVAKLTNPETIEGYTFDVDNENNKLSAIATTEASGQNSVIKMYYKLAKYTVTYNKGSDGSLDGTTDKDGNIVYTEVRFGDSIPTAPTVIPNDGYQFDKWILDGTEGPDKTVGTTNLTYTALYKKNATMTLTVGNYTGTYDGLHHQGTVISDAPGTKIEYSVDGETWSETIPTIKDVGETTYQVRGTKTGYTTARATLSLEVTPAEIEVTAVNAGKMVDQTDPALPYNVNQKAIDGENVAFSGNVVRAEGETVGTYTINQGTLKLLDNGTFVANNYTLKFNEGTFTISNNTTMTLTVNGYNGVYDGKTHQGSAKSSKEGTKIEYSVDGETWSETIPTIKDAGATEYHVRGTKAGYTTATATLSLEVIPAEIEVTAVNKDKMVDQTDPTLTYNVNQKAIDGENVAFSGNVVRAEGETVGTYTINQGTLKLVDNGAFVANNYTLKFNEGTFTISNNTTMTLTVNGYNGTYDGKTHQGSAKSSKEGTKIEYSVDGETWSETIPTIKDVGETTYQVRGTKTGYTTARATLSLVVIPAEIEVTAVNKDKMVDQTDPALTYNVNQKAIDGENVAFSGNVVRAEGETVGAYTINQGTLKLLDNGTFVANNYTLKFNEGTFTISNNTTMTLTVNGYNGVYDGKTHQGSAKSSKEGTKIEYSVDGETWSETIPTIKDVGETTYQVRGTKTGYTTARATLSLVVIPAEIEVTAVNKDKMVDQTDPALTYNVNQKAIDGENVAFSGNVVRAEGETVGTYTINQGTLKLVDNETFVANNYTLKFNEGTFTISNNTTMTLTVNGYSGTYDGKSHQGTVNSNIEGTKIEYSVDGATWSETIPTIKDVGETTYQVRGIKEGYTTAVATLILKVTPAPIKITADNASKAFNTKDPELFTYQINQNGVNGEEAAFSGSLGRITGEQVRKYDIIQGSLVLADNAAAGFKADNYSLLYAKGTFEIYDNNTLTITANGYNGVYDGTSHAGTFETNVNGATIQYSTDNGATWTTTAPSVTSVADSVIVLARASFDGYITTQPKEVSLEVTARVLTVTAANATKVFDGTPLTATSAAITDGTLVDTQEVASVTVQGSQTAVGTSVNRASNLVITADGTDVTTNYDITYVDGVLTVTASPVVPTPTPVNPTPTPTTGATVTPTTTPTATPTVVASPVATTESVIDTPAGYDLTTVADNQTPLANTDLEDWKCCILPFLLMLIAFIVMACYTKNMKNRQERIFELREAIEIEKAKRNDEE